MIFSTPLFIFLFLPLFLLCYYALPYRFRSAWILLASYLFYGWWRMDFLALIAATTLWTYGLGSLAARNVRRRRPRARAALIAGVSLNLGTLGYFKYFNFGAESIRALLSALGAAGFTPWEVILPIGISFYTFQATSYLIDVYRQDTAPADNFLDLAAYIALFPQLIAGPILRYRDLAPQFKQRVHTFEKWSAGALRFMLGFSKKVLVADTVAALANAVFALPRPTLVDSWLGALAYTVQIYFDFSGYSDMAIGLGLMMGFRFPENFNRPYLSKSITEFWRRWHISLSSWLRDYLYIPLGGNRRGTGRTYVNLLTVMILGGLWHGAAWTFAAWGAWHGLLLVGERLAGRGRRTLPPVLGVLRTMLLIVIGWVVFRAPDFAGALHMYAGMVGLYGFGVSSELSWQLRGSVLIVLAAAYLLMYAAPVLHRYSRSIPRLRIGLALGANAAVIPVFVWSVTKLLAGSYSPFLYFRF
jgi:alginate O-acetyltransferase complex protein AlgI